MAGTAGSSQSAAALSRSRRRSRPRAGASTAPAASRGRRQASRAAAAAHRAPTARTSPCACPRLTRSQPAPRAATWPTTSTPSWRPATRPLAAALGVVGEVGEDDRQARAGQAAEAGGDDRRQRVGQDGEEQPGEGVRRGHAHQHGLAPVEADAEVGHEPAGELEHSEEEQAQGEELGRLGHRQAELGPQEVAPKGGVDDAVEPEPELDRRPGTAAAGPGGAAPAPAPAGPPRARRGRLATRRAPSLRPTAGGAGGRRRRRAPGRRTAMHHRGRSPPGASGSPSAPIGGPGAGGGGRRPPGWSARPRRSGPPAPAGAVGQRVAQGDPRRAPRPEGGPGAGHRRVVVPGGPAPPAGARPGRRPSGSPAGPRPPGAPWPARPPPPRRPPRARRAGRRREAAPVTRPGAGHEGLQVGPHRRGRPLVHPAPPPSAAPAPLRCARQPTTAGHRPPAGRPRTGACPSPWSCGSARHLGRAGESGPGPPGRETPAGGSLDGPRRRCTLRLGAGTGAGARLPSRAAGASGHHGRRRRGGPTEAKGVDHVRPGDDRTAEGGRGGAGRPHLAGRRRPALRGLKGFRGVYAAVDPATHESVNVVCYDTEADARAVMDSGEYGRIVARFADVLDGPPTPRGYQVLYHTAPDAPAG